MKTITLYPERAVKDIHDLYGIFFEDINHAADGGLYGELVRNRSFEFDPIDRDGYHALTAWTKSDNLEWEICEEAPIHPNNPHYLHVHAATEGFAENEGYNSGICLEDRSLYRFRLFAKGAGVIAVQVTEETGDPCSDSQDIQIVSDRWKEYHLTLTSTRTTCTGRLHLTFTAGTDVCVDMISLFPVDTYKQRINGLRKDIAQALEELKPRFMRFPGGCLVHDGSLDKNARNSLYRWINTIGPVEERPSRRNNWGYNQSLGLGYYEYFCFCEDIGCEPLPVVPGGFNPHKGEGVPLGELEEWVNETLSLIEFANGSENTPMGKVRASLGHPAPFHLKYIGVGNEEIGDGFFERYPYFHNAIRAKYPDIQIINSAGPFATGEGYDAGWRSAVKYGSDLVDEHYYSSPEWFLANMHHYDDYDPAGPKVFLGEYASWGNTFYNALVEAAYMTHLEKAPAVALACYAPLLCNKDYTNWSPDMLFFDGHRLVKTPNYYVQKLFMTHQGDQEIAFETTGLEEVIPLSDEPSIAGAITVAGNDVEGILSDITITTPEEVIRVPSLNLRTDNQAYVLENNMDAPEYTLEFSFRRTAGRKGLKIRIGKKPEEDTYILWEFGGWDNWDCNISSFVRGRASTISHRIFHVTDEPYKLRLEVKGRTIRTYVNGVLMNDTTDRLPELEELYVAASKDAAGTLYLKCVNITGEDKEVKIALKDYEGFVAEGSLLKASLSAESTFDAEEVAPSLFSVSIGSDGFTHTFPGHSVTVFRI